ncbi:MAG: hypothetical protein CM15mP74_15450 [Halieaceae bacterium]|nr:MAG: hypothetical protein CM15mP74_15450 [Halieaceae bacterium]
MSRIVTLYRTVARYRLDQLLPSNQRPRLFSLLLRVFPVLPVPATTLVGSGFAGLWKIWGRSSSNLASCSPHAGIFCRMTSQMNSRCCRIRLPLSGKAGNPANRGGPRQAA